jgi:hypothetical protein
VFSITNRGLVLGGDIIDGIISNLIHFPFRKNLLLAKIRPVEYIDHLENKFEIGLILDSSTLFEKNDLLQFIGQTVSVSGES